MERKEAIEIMDRLWPYFIKWIMGSVDPIEMSKHLIDKHDKVEFRLKRGVNEEGCEMFFEVRITLKKNK